MGAFGSASCLPIFVILTIFCPLQSTGTRYEIPKTACVFKLHAYNRSLHWERHHAASETRAMYLRMLKMIGNCNPSAAAVVLCGMSCTG